MIALEHLQKIALFAKLNPEQLGALAGSSKEQTYFTGQEIVRQGDLGNRFFIVDDGYVNLRRTDVGGFENSLGIISAVPVPNSTIQPKTYFGEQMFTTQEPYDYSASSVYNSTLYIFERADFDALMVARPDIFKALSFIEKAERDRTRGFKWVETGEAMRLLERKHWLALVPHLAIALIGLIICVVLLWAGNAFNSDLPWMMAGLIAVFVLLYVLWEWYDWWNDEYIVTNRRVARVERVLLTQELREGIPIEKVQMVTIEKSGITAWLGMSNVLIQSAGRDGVIEFGSVANGPLIRKVINEQQGRSRARLVAEERERYRTTIQKELREYILPHVVAKENEARASMSMLAPEPKRVPILQRVRHWVDVLTAEEVTEGSTIIWRKHWIKLLEQTGRWLLALAGVTAVLVLYNLVPRFQILPWGSYFLGGLVLLVVCLAGVAWEWDDWRNDLYEITETQIIDIERMPLGLNEKSIMASLDQVQDVRVEVPGVLGSFLDFGTVRIETAGKAGAMLFHSVRHPREVADTIFARLNEYRTRHTEREASIRNRAVVDALVGYHRLLKEDERLRQASPDQASTAASSEPAAPSAPATTIEPQTSESSAAPEPPGGGNIKPEDGGAQAQSA